MSKKLKEFEVTESKGYIVWAYDKEDAYKKFGNYEYVQEGDFSVDVRELGIIPKEYVQALTNGGE
jgi:hypothetical protein